MVDTLVKLIVNIEEGWGEHFIYDVMPLKQKRPDLFPMILAAFANHPRWFIDHLKEIEMILDYKYLLSYFFCKNMKQLLQYYKGK